MSEQPTSIAALAREFSGHTITPGALHVVSTPIGNLGDITVRALAVLQDVSVICSEDTRQTRTLLQRFGIRTPLIAVHEHNEARSIPDLVARLAAGEAVALVTDAGTPLVSDPGQRLVDAVIAAGFRVVPVPGASALLSALVAGGVPAQPFTFLGFLPRKGTERTDVIRQLSVTAHTVVLYEAANRLVDTLRDLSDAAGATRPAVVARELTKVYEDIRRGTLAELAAYYEGTPPKGEVVILVTGAPAPELPTDAELAGVAADLRAEGFRPRDIVRKLMDEHGVSRNVAYKLAHEV